MNRIILIGLAILLSLTTFAQIDISSARSMSIGSVVTIKGIATNGPEIGIIRYIQDSTAAIAVYPGTGSTGNFSNDVTEGDDVTITGTLKDFNGLLEIDPVSAYTVNSSGNPLPVPLAVDATGVNETNEALLLKLNDVTFDNGGAVFSSGTYGLTDSNGNSAIIYLRSGHPLVGQTIPIANVNLTGICSQFSANHQLLPRTAADIEIASTFYLTTGVEQENLTNSSFDLLWETNSAGSTGGLYGLTDALELGHVGQMNSSTTHNLSLTGLNAGSIYYVKPYVAMGTDTAWGLTGVYSTVSNSSGTIRAIFNSVVDVNFATTSNANYKTGAQILDTLIHYIDNAQMTIDFCMYNNNRADIVNALIAAQARGVQVRYVANEGTLSSALDDPNVNFNFIKGNATSLMHNKFIVIDAESEQGSWLFSGSMNMTNNNIDTDHNNLVMIQDQALCRTYEIEFEEMWGSDSSNPGLFSRKFGDQKEDNTPHKFIIGGKDVECYFSPSDNVTNEIVKTIESADNDLSAAVLSFTRNEIGMAVADAHNNGIATRVLMENINDQGSEFVFLQNEGVAIFDHAPSDDLHHKYVIVDAAATASDPLVLTGSHNWSSAAENSNDENTLIIHDAEFANWYTQEFEARWCEVVDPNCTVDVKYVNGILGLTIELFPNPANNQLNVALDAEQTTDLNWQILSVDGRVLKNGVINGISGNTTESLDVNDLVNGMYLLLLNDNESAVSQKFEVIR